jgi:RsiW-degrading membrane proteinase PrsW (M82 family)
VGDAAARAESGQAPAAQPFDIAKFAGIFAAIGLAVGAIGTALAAAIAGLFTLAWWQLPLVVVAIIVAISGPSMLLAFMTLRRRNLGPLLDANGWAVNARARINLPFGASLTAVAALPKGSSHSMSDPYADKKRPWKAWLFLLLLAVALVVAWRAGALARLLGG